MGLKRAMMRDCQATGNRAGEGIATEGLAAERLGTEGLGTEGLAGSKAGGSNVTSNRNLWPLPGYAPMMALVVAVMILSLCHVTHGAGTPRVILLRGWFGVFSMGLDTVTEELKAQGIKAEVAGHLSWQNEVAEILHERAAGRTGPLILVGHSQGANNVIDMARLLEPHNVRIALLVTLAPYMQNPIPGNVVRAVDYYQSSGWGAPITAGPGFRGELLNVDLSSDPTVVHVNVDKNANVQAEIEREIIGVVKAN